VKFSKPEGGYVVISSIKEGDMAKFSISDTGIGISEENIARLFGSFEQIDKGTSRKYGGAGLGLAITKQMVELHGGRIWVESKYGEGTTFTFTLPIKERNKNI
jgi:signal transduction histidine kinase